MDEAKQGNHLSTVARAWTLTVLETLAVDVQDSGRRKRRVLRFLYESGLIGKNRDAVVDLARADVSKAELGEADLSGADLNGADLSRANLSRANLSRTDLSRANLTNAAATYEQLKEAESLEGATMPDGQKCGD